MAKWLESAVFYEIYPQSFLDTNGDGIGDFEGIIQKLDYIKGLGCNALWLNPCFDSPFKDAGYDVRDYRKTAARYGTNEDLKRLFSEAHGRGIHVLLDLVPGHTSEEHAWFLESRKENPAPEFAGRYIWTDNWFVWGLPGLKFIAGEAPRNGVYLINFFKCQPALNYGFLKPTESWQRSMDHPDALATREALKDIMRFWLDSGCDGFRVDMADSLVKGDDDLKSGTSALWRDVRAMLDSEYPEAVMVSEWSNPPLALSAGFHMDFMLDHPGGAREFFRGYQTEPDGTAKDDTSFFRRDSAAGADVFFKRYLPWYEAAKGKGSVSLITCNHDTPRLSRTYTPRELALAYAFIFTMPGVPFLYYGDEIGLRYQNLPSKEGGYTRTGTRTPMQWTAGKNLGFSTAPAETLYLPVDPSADAPTVEAQEKDPLSLLNTVKALLRLRAGERALQAEANLEVLSAEKGKRLAVWKRGPFVIAVNPGAKPEHLPLEGQGKRIYAIGSGRYESGELSLDAQSFCLWRKD